MIFVLKKLKIVNKYYSTIQPDIKKKGRFGNAKAAKFREETPRKGGGFAGGPAIPRRNNMMKLAGSGKS